MLPASLLRPAAPQADRQALPSTDWPPGLHHLRLDAVGRSGKSVDYRTFAVKVRSPRDRLDVVIEDSWFFAEGTHFGSVSANHVDCSFARRPPLVVARGRQRARCTGIHHDHARTGGDWHGLRGEVAAVDQQRTACIG